MSSSQALARYIAVVQFFFLSCWTVYAVYLPTLLDGVGISPTLSIWVLLADQVLFAVFDVAAGAAVDRARRLYARIGPWLVGITVLSCACLALLPWLTGPVEEAWRAPLFLALTALWAASSSALRAPVFAMISRHAPRTEIPHLAATMLMGTAVASALAPYLATILLPLDPRLPFALATLALAALSVGLIRAEQHVSPSDRAKPEERPTRSDGLRVLPVFLLIGLAALGFQFQANLNAAPRYLQDASAADLPWLMPIFWIGFHLALTRAGQLVRRRGSANAFVLGCACALVGALISMSLPGLLAAGSGQLLSGLGWGAALSAAFGLIAQIDSTRARHGSLTGNLFAVLAAATFIRLGTHAAGVARWPQWAPWVATFPALAWLAVILLKRALTHRVLPAGT